MSKQHPKSKEHPLTKTILLGRLFFRWVTECVTISKTTPWTQQMHYDLPDEANVNTHKQKFSNSVNRTKDIAKTIRTLFRGQLIEFVVSAILLAAYFFSGTLISEQLISEMGKNPDIHQAQELRWLIGMFALMAFINSSSLIVRRFYLYKAQKLSLLIRACVLAVVQEKTMRFSALNSDYFSEGNITNLLQVDVKRMAELIAQLFVVIQSASIIIMGVAFQVYLSGVVITVYIMGTYALIYSIYLFCYYYRSKFAKQLMIYKDKRMSFFRNVLNNVEYIKIRAMENFFCVKMFQYREEEITQLRKTVLVMSWESMLDWTASNLTTFVILAYFTYLDPGENMTSGTFFAFYQIFNSLKEPIYEFINNINFLIEIRVSIKRFNEFFEAEEVGPERLIEIPNKTDVAIRITNGDFEWKTDETALFMKLNIEKAQKERKRLKTQYQRDRKLSRYEKKRLTMLDEKLMNKVAEEEGMLESADMLSADLKSLTTGAGDDDMDDFELRDVNLEIKKGEKVIVFGESSQGKSSLLYCMLGEMISKHSRAKVEKSGKIGFMAQARWLIGDSIRENITLGKEFDEEWMEESLRASCLVQDLTTLNNGMDTMLGDTSDTVSGGQRARIALARCFYQK